MIERTYTVISTSYDYITVKGASGNVFDVYYPSKIGVSIGDHVVVLFDDRDEKWVRISNARTGVSAAITRIYQR